MKPNHRLVVLFSMAVALVLLAACGAAQATATTVPATEPPPPPTETPPPALAEAPTGTTVTFEGDRCVYHGPERVPAGQIPVTLDVTDQLGRGKFALGAVTLDEGKTLEDLRDWTSTTGWPLWAQNQGWVDANGGSVEETTIILFEGPFYLYCFLNPPSNASDVLGPIEVVPPASK